MATVTELIELLNKRFPKAWFKKGKDFSTSGDYDKSVWTGEDSYIGKERMFDYYSESKKYIFGAHNSLCDFVEKYGYYVECYDAGTFFIFPSEGEVESLDVDTSEGFYDPLP